MKRVPTDKMILEVIYARYYEEFAQFSHGADDQDRDTKIYVPVDLGAVARTLHVDGDIIFGRLSYYLDHKYRYQNPNGSWVHLLWLRYDKQPRPHWINFPLLASVLAGLQDDERRVAWTRWLSILSICIAVAAFALSLFATFWLKRL
jgi:hypothetical protein